MSDSARVIDTDWLLYGAAGVPAWAVVLGLIVALLAAQRWLAVERRSRSRRPAMRLLPVTLALFFLLVAAALYRPVLVRIRTLEHRGHVPVLVDTSESMATPLRSTSLSARLDLLEVWPHWRPLVATRATAARDMADLLATVGEDLQRLRRRFATIQGALEQGVPPSATDRRALAEYPQWQADRRRELLDAAAAVRLTAEAPPPPLRGDPAASLAGGLDRLEKAIALLPTEVGRTAADLPQVAPLLPSLHELRAAVGDLRPQLAAWQEGLDEAFVQDGGAALPAALETLSNLTRAELARTVAGLSETEALGQAPATVTREGGLRLRVRAAGADPQETDLYAAIGRELDALRRQPLQHLVLLSDGGHNAGGDLHSPTGELRRRGVKLLTVGIGLPAGEAADVALLDWTVSRLARAGRELRLTVWVKSTPGREPPFRLRLTGGGEELGLASYVADADGETRVLFTAEAPGEEGRHALTLTVEADNDRDPGNNAVTFPLDAVRRTPRLLLVGEVPDWDTAYLTLAARRQELDLRQAWAAGEEPKRGSFGEAVPKSLRQWQRFAAVLLCDEPFQGFAAEDAAALGRYVREEGGTLWIRVTGPADYHAALAEAFGWQPAAGPTDAEALRLPLASRHLGMLRLGLGGAESARRFAALGRAGAVRAVPPQNVTLIETEGGTPVCSLGFYGRGKVVLWGLSGLYRLRRYENAARVDRLLDGLLGDLAAPLFDAAAAERGVGVYPALPRDGAPAWTIRAAAGEPATVRRLTAASPALKLPGGGEVPVVVNPGREQAVQEFRPELLQRLAEAAGGAYASAREAGEQLAALSAPSYLTRRSTVYAVGDSAWLLAAVVAAGALHWILRKLAGLAI